MFTERLKSLRKENNITQKKLSDEINVSASTIGLYEQGRRSPDNETLTKIADYFEVTINYLLGRTNQKYFRADETISFHSKGKLSDEDMKMVRDLIDRLVKNHKEEEKKKD